jgi:hypothetical protein
MNSDVKTMVETAERVFTATETALSALQDGQRMQIDELATAVSKAVSMEPKKVLGFVNHFIHNTSVAYVTRGKNGGIRKGVRPAKVVKTPKKSKVTDAVTDSSDSTQTV